MSWIRQSSVRPHKAAARRKVLHRLPMSEHHYLLCAIAKAYGLPPQLIGIGKGWGIWWSHPGGRYRLAWKAPVIPSIESGTLIV